MAKICAAIRERGHSDTHAAAKAGVSSSAVSRWRQEDEEFAVQLDAARAEYLDVRLQVISETRKRDGSLDWRAQAWLMQMAAPDVYGPPARRSSLAREKEEQQRAEEKRKADEAEVITPEDLARFQQWRAYSLAKMNGASEEEALWEGHFLHHHPAPVFPGSLAVAGAEIAPPPQLTPEEAATLAGMRVRREAAMKANATGRRRSGGPRRAPGVKPWRRSRPATRPGRAARATSRSRALWCKMMQCSPKLRLRQVAARRLRGPEGAKRDKCSRNSGNSRGRRTSGRGRPDSLPRGGAGGGASCLGWVAGRAEPGGGGEKGRVFHEAGGGKQRVAPQPRARGFGHG